MAEIPTRLSLYINPLKIASRKSRTKSLGQKPDATLACFSQLVKRMEETRKGEKIKPDEVNKYRSEFNLNLKRKDAEGYEPSSLQGFFLNAIRFLSEVNIP